MQIGRRYTSDLRLRAAFIQNGMVTFNVISTVN
jgi:hypothetical protein